MTKIDCFIVGFIFGILLPFAIQIVFPKIADLLSY